MSVLSVTLDVSGYLSNFVLCLEDIRTSLAWTIPGKEQEREAKEISFVEGIERVVVCIETAKTSGASLIFIGNGGSAAIASHQTADFMKAGVRAFAPLDHSLITCFSNDFGYESAFANVLKVNGKKGDVLFAVSSSGESKNILNAVEVAKSKGMTIITLSGFDPLNSLRKIGEINFYAPSNSYRHVESAHLFVFNCILDFFLAVTNYHTAPTWA
ncbi:MAG: SIS domain-containing protein [bacterium]|nr:SIS domain-containing protein [bacterium]